MPEHEHIVAIGDIHGCAASARALLNKLSQDYDENLTYVFLGDYTDRGPASKQVVDDLLEFNKNHRCIFIRGNHDQMLLDAYEKGNWNIWLSNGGNTTLLNYDSAPGNFNLPEDHYRFFNSTKLYWQTEVYFFVHGGIAPNLTIEENLESKSQMEDFLWYREHIYAHSNKWEKTVIFGHTPVKKPIVRETMIGIDTGCVYKDRGYGILTALLLPEKKFIEQDCLDF